MHEVLVNRLGGLSLPRKSVVRLTDRPDMTLDVYRGRKTTMQQQQQRTEMLSTATSDFLKQMIIRKSFNSRCSQNYRYLTYKLVHCMVCLFKKNIHVHHISLKIETSFYCSIFRCHSCIRTPLWDTPLKSFWLVLSF